MSLPLAFLVLLVEAFGFLVAIYFLRERIRELRLESETFQRERKTILAFLDKTGERITTDLDLEGTLDIITEFIVDASQAQSGAIFIVDEAGGEFLTARSVVGLFPPIHAKVDRVLARPKFLKESLKHDKVRVGEGLIGRVAADGQPLLIADATRDPQAPMAASGMMPLETLMLAPLRVRGRILGVFAVVNKRGEGGAFTEADMNLLMALADQAAVTVDIWRLYQEMARKQRIEQDLRVAREFQRLLLPGETPRVAGFDIAAYNETALDIGGDYYDFIPIDDRHLGIAIADVSGKGIPGALIMAMVRSSLRTEALRSLSPKAVLRNVNERLLGDTSDNVFITMTYGVLDTVSRRLVFARCGHEPTITCRAEGGPEGPAVAAAAPAGGGRGKLNLHTPEGVALGLVGGEWFEVVEEMELALAPGTVMALYTDGVVEAMDAQRAEYGQERFFRIIENHCGTARELVDAVVRDIARFTRGIPQYDDVTMVVVRSLSAEEEAARAVVAQAADGPAAAQLTGTDRFAAERT